jgi:hypothetical protein
MKNTTEFLSGEPLLQRLSEALKASGRADLAIAYWGDNAIATLGMDKMPGPTRIICDAYSGACNPEELKKLIAKFEVRTRNGLHAKVVITGTSVFVGSANASANGLGQEGVEANNVEAAALIQNVEFLRQAQDWFDAMWADSREVTADVISAIRPIWRERRKVRPVGALQSSSLLGVLLTDPRWFADRAIRLVAYESADASAEAQRTFNSIAPSRYHSAALQKYENDGEVPYYEDTRKWDVPLGEYIVDFRIDESKQQADFGGFWMVKAHDAFHKAGPNSRIILLDKVKDFKGLRLSRSDAARLGKFVFKYVANNHFKTDRNDNMMEKSLADLGELLRAEVDH